jgi:glycosyltransferase involved in cell wall biosynthesis
MPSSNDGMRVGIDATSLFGSRTGIGHVTAEIIGTLVQRGDVDVTAFAVTWRGRSGLRDQVPAGVDVRTRPVPARLARQLWARVGRPRAEHWSGSVDVVHAPNYVAPPARAPVIVTVHDLTFARFPKMCTADTLTFPTHIQRALDAGATIHTASDFVAHEMREVFDVAPERVVRIYTGMIPSAGGDAAVGRVAAGADRYVLALGTIEPRKNLPRLVDAFDAIAARHEGLVLVLAGPDGWGAPALERSLDRARHSDRVRRLGYADDATRRGLLAGATVLAYPSIYEGFGHPPLEAMKAGVPVVAAAAGSMPEVLGDAALLPDPFDVDSIATALDQALSDETQRQVLVQRGFERIKRFSWPRAGEELVALYRKVSTA